MSRQVRTRFAPSPSGYLHIGGARTALFSWLFARANKGKFILRVEDTDAQRSSEESVDVVLRDMRWLGLDWDEGPADDNRSSRGEFGPYFQSQRTEIYASYLQKLKDENLAYASFESKEEVEAVRDASISSGGALASAGFEADEEEIAGKAKQGIQPAWRFRMPQDGVTEFVDLVHGKTRFENRLMADIVIFRSDGSPTYNFAATVDDCLMGISHVIRGDDHISNTPRQICLARALGFTPPQYAHIPIVLGGDKQRLSKRHGATSVGEYKDQGFLPEAVMNYLALLGWSLDEKTTKISSRELQKAFTMERVGKSATVFDTVKMEWLNGQYVKEADTARIAELAWPMYVKAGFLKDEEKEERWDWFKLLVKSLQDKVRRLADLPEETRFFFLDFEKPQEQALDRFYKAGDPGDWLKALADRLQGQEAFDPDSIEVLCRGFADEKEIKFSNLVGPLRAALSGQVITPGIFETISLLGKEKSIQRIMNALQWPKPAKTEKAVS